MSVLDVETIQTEQVWARVSNVVCVVCPECLFTFDEDDEGDDGHVCPECKTRALASKLAELQRSMDEVVKREAEFRSRFTVECEACRGEGTQITNWQPPHGCNGYYERVTCGECEGWGRIPKRSDA